MQLFSRSLFRVSALAATLVGASALHATSLVNGFNVVTLGNFTSSNSDLQGTLAVGQNLTLSGYALNQSAPHPNTAAGGFDTVVGGAFQFSNGTLYGKVSAASATVTSAGVCAGCVTTGGADPLDFSAVAVQGKAQSSFFYTLSPTGSVTKPYSTLLLNASGPSLLQVFSITSAQLSGNSGINITGLAANVTVVINVTDSGTHTAQTSSAGLQINGTQVQSASNVLFNFADTFTGISIANSFYSSILAPTASVTGGYGAFNGDLFAAAYSGHNQFNHDPFSGTLPSATPEPGTLGMLSAVGLLGLGVVSVRARRTGSSPAV